MKITYVVLTCEKYLSSRIEWIKNTWMNKIDSEDEIYFLSSTPNIENNIIGYDDPDDYGSAPLKKMSFFKNFNLGDSDWLFFCDDDTFVFPSRLKKELSLHTEENKNICICRKGVINDIENNFNIQFPIYYPSGGAGFAINNYTFNNLKLKLNSIENIPYVVHGDISFGLWCRLLDNFEIIDISDVLKSQNPDHEENIGLNYDNVLTMHYCNEEHFNNLNNI